MFAAPDNAHEGSRSDDGAPGSDETNPHNRCTFCASRLQIGPMNQETSEQTSVTKGDFEDDNSEANNKDSIYNTDTTWQAAKWSTAPYQKLIGELAYGD